MSDTICWGVYTCRRCKRDYTVNDGTWRLCTPEFCQDCYGFLKTLYALVPVDKDGKDVQQ